VGGADGSPGDKDGPIPVGGNRYVPDRCRRRLSRDGRQRAPVRRSRRQPWATLYCSRPSGGVGGTCRVPKQWPRHLPNLAAPGHSRYRGASSRTTYPSYHPPRDRFLRKSPATARGPHNMRAFRRGSPRALAVGGAPIVLARLSVRRRGGPPALRWQRLLPRSYPPVGVGVGWGLTSMTKLVRTGRPR
jgi:hypothetical protein